MARCGLMLLSPGRLAVLPRTGSARRARRPVAMTLIWRLHVCKCEGSAQPLQQIERSCESYYLRVFKAFVRFHPGFVVDAGVEADQNGSSRG